MSDALKKVEAYRLSLMHELLAQCEEKQQAFFHRLFPDGPEPDKVNGAIQLIERTLEKNRKKAEITVELEERCTS